MIIILVAILYFILGIVFFRRIMALLEVLFPEFIIYRHGLPIDLLASFLMLFFFLWPVGLWHLLFSITDKKGEFILLNKNTVDDELREKLGVKL